MPSIQENSAVLPEGRKIVIREFAENPADAIKNHMELAAQAAPDPRKLKPDEVIMHIRAASVSWVDLLMTSGQYQHMPQPPYIPGIDYSGDVAAVGSALDPTRYRVGNRFIADPIKVGPRSSGSYRSAGGLATYAVLPANSLIPVPDILSFDQAAVLLQAYETAYHCLVSRGNLQAGETILINGATGLTGLAAVEMAKMLGATVIATGRYKAKLEQVLDVGADHTIRIVDDKGELRPFRDDVKKLTGGHGVDVVYDAVGGAVSLESMRCAAFGARFLIVGWTSTPDVARGKGMRGAPNANMLPTNIIQMKSLTVMGCPSAIAVAKDPSIRPARLERILNWASEGRIRPRISHVFDMDQFKQAFEARWTGQVTGGCVVHP